MPADRRALVLVLALAAGCGGDAPGRAVGCGAGAVVDGRPVRIVTTVAPLTSIVASVASGTGAIVTGVVPEGRDSHTFEPTPSVAAVLEQADVVFLNGLGLEEPTRELALANLREGAEVCELGTTVLPPDDYVFDVSFPEAGGSPNPHAWMNPRMVEEYAVLVRDVLVARDPANAGAYRSNHDAFAVRVAELDAALRAATATVPTRQRLLLTYHDAYAYFAREYGWTVVAAVQPSSFDEPTPREVADLIEQVRAREVPAIFGSEEFPSPVLEQIAAETGATYVDDLRDDVLPGEPGDADHTWFELMRINSVTVVEAVGGDASALRALDSGDASAPVASAPPT